MAKFHIQVRALLEKNVLLAKRNRRATFLQLFASFFFVLFVFLVDESVKSSQSQETRTQNLFTPADKIVTDIPECNSSPKGFCYDFIYSPNDESVVEALVASMRNNNVPAIPQDRVRGFASQAEADAYMLANTEVVNSGVAFNVLSDKKIHFAIQSNSTVRTERGQFVDANEEVQLPLQVAVEREIVRHLTGVDVEWDVGFREFPHPAYDEVSIQGTVGPQFFFAASIFGFVIEIGAIATDKETNIRDALGTMGMTNAAYWTAWLIWEIVMNFLSSMLLCIFGLIFQFDLFVGNAFGTYFFLIFLFQLSMMSFAFLLSTFVSKSSSASFVGFCVFFVGFVFQLVVAFGYPFTSSGDEAGRVIFALFPPTLLMKGFQDLGEFTATAESPGIGWGERDSYCVGNCVFSLNDIYAFYILDCFLFLVLALYLDNVLPSKFGVKKDIMYFLRPSYWKGTSVVDPKPLPEIDDDERPDDDVEAEEREVLSRDPGDDDEPVAIELRQLFKQFGADFQAVKGVSYRIHSGRLFCLLGPNGAGKTTTINMLTGLLPVSAGDVRVLGRSILSSSGMEYIKPRMGVCPQFDVLWPLLTGAEHLRVFGLVKGVEVDNIEKEVGDRLEQMSLTSAKDQMAGVYSGGMRRRLSVAIAFIGDPEIVYLDEPTTGMDPVSRRFVWDVIEHAKADRAVVLTTHSMEEADILGDQVGIMVQGRLKCLGSPLRLKQKFGSGYRVSVAVESEGNDAKAIAERKRDIEEYFKKKIDTEPEDDAYAYIHFVIPREKTQEIVSLFDDLETNSKRLGITDIQVSLTTLEEVFLSVAGYHMGQSEEGDDDVKVKGRCCFR